MANRGRLALLLVIVAVGSVLAVANVVGTSGAGAEHGPDPLIGPDAPAPRALPGEISFRAAGCQAGSIDLVAAELRRDPIPTRCNEERGRPAPSLPIHVGQLTLTAAMLAGGADEDEELLGVVGYDEASSGRVGVVVAVRGSERLRQVLQVWTGDGLERSVQLASVREESIGVADDFGLSGLFVRLSPDVRELAIDSTPGRSRVTLFDLTTGRRTLLRAQKGLDWSPDGRWLAVSTGEEILVYGASREAHVYALPVEAGEIAWAATSETR